MQIIDGLPELGHCSGEDIHHLNVGDGEKGSKLSP
jgi:hypothetical protein